MKATGIVKYPENLYRAVFGIAKNESFVIPDETEKTVTSVLYSLEERERFVLLELYKEGKTLQKVAELCGVSKSRVSQIERKALRKLRHPKNSKRMMLGDSGYKDYVLKKQLAKEKLIADATEYGDSLPIEELELTVRLYNCLKRNNINSLGDIFRASPEQIMKMRNFGRKSALVLMKKLDEAGVGYNWVNSREFTEDTADFFGIKMEEQI